MRVLSKSSCALACAALFALFTAAGGCVPTVYNQRPEVKGTVRDTSGKPIPDAVVRVFDPARPDGPNGSSDRTDAEGRFKVPPGRKFGMYKMMGKKSEWSWVAKAEAPGHTAASVELTHSGTMPKMVFENVKFRLPPQ